MLNVFTDLENEQKYDDNESAKNSDIDDLFNIDEEDLSQNHTQIFTIQNLSQKISVIQSQPSEDIKMTIEEAPAPTFDKSRMVELFPNNGQRHKPKFISHPFLLFNY